MIDDIAGTGSGTLSGRRAGMAAHEHRSLGSRSLDFSVTVACGARSPGRSRARSRIAMRGTRRGSGPGRVSRRARRRPMRIACARSRVIGVWRRVSSRSKRRTSEQGDSQENASQLHLSAPAVVDGSVLTIRASSWAISWRFAFASVEAIASSSAYRDGSSPRISPTG
jgi:hypothetical protein